MSTDVFVADAAPPTIGRPSMLSLHDASSLTLMRGFKSTKEVSATIA